MRTALALIAASVVLFFWVTTGISGSTYVTRQGVAREQPVPFSHEHHVSGLGIDCRYCHTSVEISSNAGLPPTKICMNCHAQMWAASPMLAPVRESWRTGVPIRWTRVHDLPGFVYFNHAIHVNKGIGCASCHGPVDRMPLMWQHAPLTMEWCLDCHRNPALHVRPREAVFDMNWAPSESQQALGRRLVAEYDIESETSCSICHR